jgi:hypothetical protein
VVLFDQLSVIWFAVVLGASIFVLYLFSRINHMRREEAMRSGEFDRIRRESGLEYMDQEDQRVRNIPDSQKGRWWNWDY